MFGRWLNRATEVNQPLGSEQLENAVRVELSTADEETVLVVTAMTGLLGIVGQADGDFSAAERNHVREELSRISGLTGSGTAAICATLTRHIREISAVQMPRYCRVLRDLADSELRIQVLDMLVALAAADLVVTTTETNIIRQITSSLGLTQKDYNTAQAKHRERLAVLKGAQGQSPID
jgi:uncharacterized tellurite resistance protein B-like protein